MFSQTNADYQKSYSPHTQGLIHQEKGLTCPQNSAALDRHIGHAAV